MTKIYAYSMFPALTVMKAYACVCSSSSHPPAVPQQYISFGFQADGTQHAPEMADDGVCVVDEK